MTLAASGRITGFPPYPRCIKMEDCLFIIHLSSAKGVLALTDVRCSAYPQVHLETCARSVPILIQCRCSLQC